MDGEMKERSGLQNRKRPFIREGDAWKPGRFQHIAGLWTGEGQAARRDKFEWKKQSFGRKILEQPGCEDTIKILNRTFIDGSENPAFDLIDASARITKGSWKG